jgi:fructosamine-3-kinase
MTAEELRRATERFFRSHAELFGLEASAVEVSYVLNWGGFVNFSYHVSDGDSRLHVKLATTEAAQDALACWHDLDPLLRRYHAPAVLAQVEVAGAKGLLFRWLPGAPPSLAEDVAGSILPCAARLWADTELAARLRTDQTITAADCYADTYHDRFTADLAAIESAPPLFVEPADLEYMRAQVDALSHRIGETGAFQEEMTSPIHGDLWLNNVLWQSPASWWLLDWDDVKIGDPAMDLAMLTGPTSTDLRPLKRVEMVADDLAPDVKERLPLLGRAALLDWVIDPLADWIDAAVAPELQAEVRSEKERLHRAALALYRELYPAAAIELRPRDRAPAPAEPAGRDRPEADNGVTRPKA